MTRGRKKDLTIPPTRALVQQRDYRARKAHYVADLEERVHKAETENMQLRRDLEVARAGLALPSAPLNSQVAEASRDLMHHLSLTMDSLGNFQHLAFPADKPRPGGLPSLQLPPVPGPPISFPSPAPSPPFSQDNIQRLDRTTSPASTGSLSPNSYHPPGRKRLYREDSPEPPRLIRNVSPRPDSSRRSYSIQSEDSGGTLGSRDPIKEWKDNGDKSRRPSAIRSTSEQSYAYEDDFQHSD